MTKRTRLITKRSRPDDKKKSQKLTKFLVCGMIMIVNTVRRWGQNFIIHYGLSINARIAQWPWPCVRTNNHFVSCYKAGDDIVWP